MASFSIRCFYVNSTLYQIQDLRLGKYSILNYKSVRDKLKADILKDFFLQRTVLRSVISGQIWGKVFWFVFKKNLT